MIDGGQNCPIQNQDQPKTKIDVQTIETLETNHIKSERPKKVVKKIGNVFKKRIEINFGTKFVKKDRISIEKQPINKKNQITTLKSIMDKKTILEEERIKSTKIQKEKPDLQINRYSKLIDQPSLMLKKLSSLETTVPTPNELNINKQYIQCNLIDKSEIMFKLQQANQVQRMQQFFAFWRTKCCYVRLLRCDNLEQCPISGQDMGWIRVFGLVKIKIFYFIVTQCYQNMTFDQYLKQYGGLNQKFIKKCMRKLINSLIILHSSQCYFNVLSTQKIYIDSKGQLKLDVIKAKYNGKITNQEIKKYFYFIHPQLSILGKNSYRNDLWSIGSIGLAMASGTHSLHITSEIHPYNNLQHFKQKTKNKYPKQFFLKIDKIQKSNYILETTSEKLKKSSPTTSILKIKTIKSGSESPMKMGKKNMQISENFNNFIEACFYPKQGTDLKDLIKHPFLKQEGFFI